MEEKEILSVRWFNCNFCIYRVNNSCFLHYVDCGEMRRTMEKIQENKKGCRFLFVSCCCMSTLEIVFFSFPLRDFCFIFHDKGNSLWNKIKVCVAAFKSPS